MALKKKNVIIYARYSSELQNDRSIEDQVAACKQALLADEQVTHVFEDRAKSGSSMATRDGLAALLAELEKGRCSVILTEGLDRLSRDMCDTAHIYRLAIFHDVAIRTLIDGPINKITLGFKGAMNGVQLDDLKHRTRRGQVGKILAGKAAGGLPYGYDVQYLNDDGVPERGLRKINPEQAAVVRSIYEDYAAGKPVLQIVKRLNAAGIPSPRGSKWSAVTITGHYDRGDGILQNPLYRGLLVWGRCPEVKHPVTNKRQIRTSAPEERANKEVPELRIMEDDLWFTVQKIRQKKRHATSRRQPFNRFDLHCVCAVCGEKMLRSDHKYLICSTHKRHQNCHNYRRVLISELLQLLYDRLSKTSHMLWQEWQDELQTIQNNAAKDIANWHNMIRQADAENKNLIKALATDLAISKMVKQHILENEQVIERLEQQIAERRALSCVTQMNEALFRAALAQVNTSDETQQILSTFITSVSLDRCQDDKMMIASVKPDFIAIAKLAIDIG